MEFVMNSSEDNSIAGASGFGEFEETLRLVARLEPPEGLEERVLAKMRTAPASGRARVLAWPVALRLDSPWMRSAAAAAIVAVVIGGSWGVYSRVQSIQPTRAITVPLHLSTQGGFSSAGAMRTPQTLNGPMVVHPVPAVTLPTKPDIQPAVKRPLPPATIPETGKAPTPPNTSPAK
jgi:hypothetical protein